MSKKYDFSHFDKAVEAAPAKQEKYDFSHFDDAVTEDSNKPSKFDSAAMGVAQSALLGNADEAGGGIQVLLDKLFGGTTDVDKVLKEGGTLPNGQKFEGGATGDLLPTSGDLYRKSRDENRVTDKQLQEANPEAYFAGSLAGGFLPGMGVSKLVGATKGAALAKGLEGPLNAPGAWSKILNAGQQGLVSGAAMGLGGSEADLTQGEFGTASKDILMGGAAGGVLGAGIQGGIESIKAAAKIPGKLKNALKDTKVGEEMAESYGFGKEKMNPFSRSQIKDTWKTMEEQASKLGLNVEELRATLGAELGAARKAAKDAGHEINVADELKLVENAINKMRENAQDPANASELKRLSEWFINTTKGMADEIQVPVSEVIPEQTIVSPGKPGAADALLEKLRKERAKRGFMGGEPAAAEEAGDLGRIVTGIDDAGNPITQPTLRGGAPVGAGEDIGLALQDLPAQDGKPYKGIFDKLLGKVTNVVEDVPGVAASEQVIPQQLKPLGTQNIEFRPGNALDNSYSQAQKINEQLTNMSRIGGQPLESNTALNSVGTAAKGIKQKLNEAPNVKPLNDKLARLYQILEDAGLKREEVTRTNPLTGDEELNFGVVKSLMNKIRSSEGDSMAGQSAKSTLDNAFNALEEIAPGKFDGLRKEMQKSASFFDISRQAQGLNPLNKSTWFQKGGIAAGYTAGRGVRILSDVYNSSPEQFRNLVSAIGQKGEAGARVAKHLAEYETRDAIGRNALLFSLEQNPEYRKSMEEFFKGK